MSETRKRTLEKSDSIPTEEIILGPQDENTEKTENIEGKVSGVVDLSKNIRSEIPQSGDTGILSQQLSSLSPKWRNWWIRIAMSWLMLFGFIFVGYCGPIAIVLLVLAIQIKCFHEVRKDSPPFKELKILTLLRAFNAEKFSESEAIEMSLKLILDHYYWLYGL